MHIVNFLTFAYKHPCEISQSKFTFYSEKGNVKDVMLLRV